MKLYNDYLGNTRVTYEPILFNGNLSYTIKGVFDYFPYSIRLRFYNPEEEKYLTTQHQRDTETSFDYRGARFYDADIARFLSVDPHSVDYAALSGFMYVAGNPIRYIDPDGKDIIVLNNSEGASGFGHMALLVGNDESGWTYMSFNGRRYNAEGKQDGTEISGGEGYYTLKDMKEMKLDKILESLDEYDQKVRYSTTEEEDKKAKESFKLAVKKDYHFLYNNCADACSESLESVGIDGGTVPNTNPHEKIRYPKPNDRMKQIIINNESETKMKTHYRQGKRNNTDDKN